jgi:DNA-binding CsgD family transcriptional regulator
MAAVASQNPSRFVQAERSARLLGNTWMQLSALVWSAALNPSRWTLVSLHRLLRLTGWRRVPFVPRQIAGDAALGLTAAGLRGPEIVELALVADRPNVTLDVAQRHLDDPRTTVAARDAALSAIAKLGTTRSRELLHRASRRGDEAGVRARSLLGDQQAGGALSDREVEVLDLAGRGLTNKEIAARLFLSQHTVARHLANSREKLGAANRTEAATKLVELGSSQDR